MDDLNFKHTPGPWSIESLHYIGPGVMSDTLPIKAGDVMEGTYKSIAYVICEDRVEVTKTDDEGEYTEEEYVRANAYLIAAAPDMFETIEALLRRLRFKASPDAKHYASDDSYWISLGEATIAKAKGQDNGK